MAAIVGSQGDTNMINALRNAIIDSIHTDSIVHVDVRKLGIHELDAVRQMAERCEGEAVSGDTHEFWGGDSGEEWRVHLDGISE
jgi:hypothetical protein